VLKTAIVILLLLLSLAPAYPTDQPKDAGITVIDGPKLKVIPSTLYTYTDYVRAVVYAPSLNDLDGNVSFAFKLGSGYIAGVVTKGELGERVKLLFYDRPLTFHSELPIYAQRYATTLTMNNLTGEGVRIGVVDTGVDFSHPDIYEALAKEDGLPLALDADGQGIALVEVEVPARIEEGALANMSYIEYPYVTVLPNGTYIDFGEEFEVSVYNPLFPYLGDKLFNVTVSGLWKIGEGPTESIISLSGKYRFGVLAEVQPIYYEGEEGLALFLFPVLMVDDKVAGRYETIYVDLSSTYKDYMNFLADEELEEPDYSFYDERPHRLGDGTEILAEDYDGDGYPDISAGMLGAYVLDAWGVIGDRLKRTYLGPSYGKPLQPIDYNGTYFTVMYDAIGHGTSVAGVAASRGMLSYDITKEGMRLPGVAPEAKIVAVKALWVTDVLYAWFWLAGMEYDGGSWSYTGSSRADIVVNSFGISDWPYMEGMPGKDILSLLADILSIPGSIDPEYKGMLMVVSAGNGGPGRGTVTPPGSSDLVLTVGASTSMDWTKARDEVLWEGSHPARIGGVSDSYDEIAGWSARGPTLSGTPKPELVAPGMYGFSILPVTFKGDGSSAYGVFGGTSMAAPIVAGCAAGILQGLRERGLEINPPELKPYLTASTRSLGYGPNEQGSGLLDFEKAVKGALEGWGLVAYSEIQPETYRNLLEYDLARLNISLAIGPLKPVKTTTLKFPFLFPNQTYDKFLKVESKRKFSAEALRLERVDVFELENVSLLETYDPLLGEDGGWIPRYIPLKENLSKYDEVRITLIYPRNYFYDISKSYVYYDALNRLSLFVYRWNDVNGDGAIWYNETELVSLAAGWTNVQRLSLSENKEGLLLGIYETPKLADYWSGRLHGNVSKIPFKIKVEGFNFVKDDNIELQLRDDGVLVKVTAPQSPGIYDGFIRLSSGEDELWIPYTYEVMVKVDGFDRLRVINVTGIQVPADLSWRYESGDWYFFRIRTGRALNSLTFNMTWTDKDDGLSGFIFDKYGRLVGSTVWSGGLMKVFGWPSTDWLGPAGLGSGGFYPAKSDFSKVNLNAEEDFLYTVALHMTTSSGKGEANPILMVQASYFRNTTTPPAVYFDDVNWTVISGTYVFNWTIQSEAPYRSKYRIDLGEWKEDRAHSVKLDTTTGKDGTHLLSVMVEDASGYSSLAILPFVVDNTPPIIDLEGIEEGEYVAGRLTFNVTVEEPHLQQLAIKVGERWYNTTSKKYVFNFTTAGFSGPVEVKVYALDTVGHTSTASYTFYVDNDPPVISITSPTQGEIITKPTKIEFEILEENLKNSSVLIDGVEFIGEMIDPSRLPDGEHTLSVKVIDKAGNMAFEQVRFSTYYYGSLVENYRFMGILIGLAVGAIAFSLILILKKRLKRE
jgi:subtilisin family serine protease